ncbi:MAG: Rieske 2Fe-2S domain-containing protein [Nitrososphaeraceae archaeon]|nr:Rieske 2Fe-2S domain-containing protein [Nitrososphaeraceae archaeon]
MAIFKDARRKAHRYSAECNHMGCAVVWKLSEESFDCHCHGSRFSACRGKAINGPANSDLTYWKQKFKKTFKQLF